MIAALCILGFAATKIDVALVARIYYKPGNKRISKHLVYLCDLHGRGRTQISKHGEEVEGIQWLDRFTLDWISVLNPDQPTETRVRYRYDLKTRKIRPLERGRALSFPADSTPLLPCEDETDDPRNVLSKSQSRSDSVTVSEEDAETLIVKTGGKTVRTRMDGEITLGQNSKMNKVWIRTWTHDSTTGTHYGLFLLDWKTGKPVKIYSDAQSVDQIGSLYAAVRSRDVSPYGKVTVWTADAWAGDIQTSRTWPIISGQVHASNIKLRPVK